MRSVVPKIMLGFVVRRCAVAVGHDPSPEEFAAWANAYRQGGRTVYLFGRPISTEEARLILRHRGRPVAARGAAGDDRLAAGSSSSGAAGVASLAEARARREARAGRKLPAGRG